MIVIEVETDSGVYRCKRPEGLMAIKHVGILSRYAANNPTTDVDENGNTIVRMSIRDQERFTEGFEQWAEKVLPNILLDGNPYPYEEMPGEDMMACYVKVSTFKSDASFRNK